MKVVRKFSMGRFSACDKLVRENMTDIEAQALTKRLNMETSLFAGYWHFAEQDDYKLWRGVTELI